MIRNPHSTRPWQHVLEPLLGYLVLAERLATDGASFAGAWNFGPNVDAVRPVSELADAICSLWGRGAAWHSADAPAPHEAGILALDASKARDRMAWRPRLGLKDALEWTVAWRKAFDRKEDMRDYSVRQIHHYETLTP